MEFQGKNYSLNQMREMRDEDSLAPLSDWLTTSKVGEYTKYYTYVVFHTESGFYAAYSDNLENYWSP